IPTRNGGATVGPLLDAIARQRVDLPVEIVVVDSSSDDGSEALLRQRARVFERISVSAFNHGLTRNLAVEKSRGDLIVLTVQDALPASDDWLAALIAPLRSDAAIAGAFAQQIPRPDASPLTRRQLETWVAASTTPRRVTLTPGEFESMTPAARLERCAFDNVCACVRRTVWQQHPFREVLIAEDLAWAKDVLLAGHVLQFVPDAAVIHSHERTPQYEFDRTRLLHAELFKLFGLRTIPSLPALTRAIASSIANHTRVQPGLRGLHLAVAWPLGQYLGARDAQ
ncbi:MAG TPA: glycosyltransferase, partial [Vicinamibacterales bacterium]|nr:glycosyltransferase [Vicinamibacterales bacterium]